MLNRYKFLGEAFNLLHNVALLGNKLKKAPLIISVTPLESLQVYLWASSRIKRKLGRDDQYWLLFDPWENSSGNLCLSTLSDDLADIYVDLLSGLILWELDTQETKLSALFRWRTNFLLHTGWHIEKATPVIWDLLSNKLSANI